MSKQTTLLTEREAMILILALGDLEVIVHELPGRQPLHTLQSDEVVGLKSRLSQEFGIDSSFAFFSSTPTKESQQCAKEPTQAAQGLKLRWGLRKTNI
jgi:hypothetical protein